MTLAPDDPRHGTANGYRHLACRCDACREASTLAQRAFRGSKPFQPAQHGTRSKYVRGCRCDECRAADTRYHAERRKQAVS